MAKMIVEIISIGDEILAGNILDTNKQYLSDACWQLGFKVEYHTSVRDDEKAIRDALLHAAERADAVICTGGLGPTSDDFTIDVAAKTFGAELVTDQASLDYLQKLFERKGRELKENNKKQALIPKGGRALENTIGTAPGVSFEFKKTQFYFLPGVPREMIFIFKKSVLPDLLSKRPDQIYFKTKFLKTFGSTESDLDNKLRDLMHDRTEIENARIGFRFHFPEIFIKISVWDADEKKAEQSLEKVVTQIYDRIGEFVYSENEDQTLEMILIEKLVAARKTVAVAESCTGGLIANRMTNISGSSEVFLGGIVSYSNELKEQVLHVDPKILKEHGAVSQECAEAMVRGVHQLTGADFCASVTGIAGPTGGTPDKPVGTVHIATLCDGELFHKQYHISFPREMFKEVVSSVVLKRFLGSIKHSSK